MPALDLPYVVDYSPLSTNSSGKGSIAPSSSCGGGGGGGGNGAFSEAWSGGDYAKVGVISGLGYSLGLVVIWFAPDTSKQSLDT